MRPSWVARVYVLAIYFFKGKVKVFRVFKWPSPTLEEGREEVFRMFRGSSRKKREEKNYILCSEDSRDRVENESKNKGNQRTESKRRRTQ